MITEAVVGSVVDFQACWAELELPAHVREVLSAAPLVQAPETRQGYTRRCFRRRAGLGEGAAWWRR